jgi:hypothetical protein
MPHETFLTLLKDPAHWEFEIFLIIIFDGLIGLILWPKIKKFLRHYKSDDKIIHDLEEKHDLENKLKN